MAQTLPYTLTILLSELRFAAKKNDAQAFAQAEQKFATLMHSYGQACHTPKDIVAFITKHLGPSLKGEEKNFLSYMKLQAPKSQLLQTAVDTPTPAASAPEPVIVPEPAAAPEAVSQPAHARPKETFSAASEQAATHSPIVEREGEQLFHKASAHRGIIIGGIVAAVVVGIYLYSKQEKKTESYRQREDARDTQPAAALSR